MVVRSACSALLAILLCDCSLAYVQGPPADAAAQAPAQIECTSAWTLPITDYAISLGSYVGAFFAMDRVLEPDTRAAPHINTRGLKIIGVATLVSLPWFVSGEVGRRRVRACRNARHR